MRFYCDANFCFIQCVNVTKVPDFFIYDLSETFFKKRRKMRWRKFVGAKTRKKETVLRTPQDMCVT